MTVNTLSGAKISIGPVAGAATDTSAEFIALTPYTLIGEVENMGEIGDESGLVQFAAVGDVRTRKMKGAKDAGVLVLVCGKDAADTGQLAMIAAEATKFDYAFKIELADKLTAAGTNSFIYFRGQVTSKRNSLGSNDNVVRITFNIAVNSPLVEVDPT